MYCKLNFRKKVEFLKSEKTYDYAREERNLHESVPFYTVEENVILHTVNEMDFKRKMFSIKVDNYKAAESFMGMRSK